MSTPRRHARAHACRRRRFGCQNAMHASRRSGVLAKACSLACLLTASRLPNAHAFNLEPPAQRKEAAITRAPHPIRPGLGLGRLGVTAKRWSSIPARHRDSPERLALQTCTPLGSLPKVVCCESSHAGWARTPRAHSKPCSAMPRHADFWARGEPPRPAPSRQMQCCVDAFVHTAFAFAFAARSRRQPNR